MIKRIDTIDVTSFALGNEAEKVYLTPSAVAGICVFDEFIGIATTDGQRMKFKNDSCFLTLLNKYFNLDEEKKYND